jgi:phospholipid:diacylglycerol acyltransferase
MNDEMEMTGRKKKTILIEADDGPRNGRKSVRSISKSQSRSPSSKKHQPQRHSRGLITFIVLIAAAVLVKHPRSSPMVMELLSPAERLLSELDRWGNFTVTATIRNAINDVFNASSTSVERELPFYIDIIATAANSTVKRPVFFLPGYITSGLEVWANLPCANVKFRDRIWGTAQMVKLFITNPKCWVDHMLLHPIYGAEIDGIKSVHFSDPVGVRIKPASGLASADFVIGDYWVWNPIIEALGYAGYDESRMWMMSYDWRLPLRDLEHKDRFFSRMVLEIEKLVKLNDDKVLMVTHSYGAKVWFFFLNWASYHLSPEWIDDHIYATYNVGPVLLGVPKAISALLSGDTRDTAQLGALSTLVDSLLPPSDRSALTASWGSIVDMLPGGGRSVWKDPMLYLNSNLSHPFNVTGALGILFKTTAMEPHAHHYGLPPNIMRCPTDSAPKRSCYRDDWADPSAIPLPKLKRMQIWCAYGIGIPTEVGYHYSTTSDELSNNSVFRIDTSLNDEERVKNGIILSDGDGTVPVESLGLMCAQEWKSGARLNPHNLTVNVRELVHGDSYSVLSRATSVGGSSVDHVDIMGNRVVVRDVLQLALGLDKTMEAPTTNSVIDRMNISL